MFVSLIKKLGGLALFLVGLFCLFGTVTIAWTSVANPELDPSTGWGLGGFFAVTSAMFLWVGWAAMQAKPAEQTARVSPPPSTKQIKRWKHGRSVSRVIGAFIFCASLLLVWHSAASAKFVAEYRGEHNIEATYNVVRIIPWIAIAGWLIGFRLMWPKTESVKTFDAKGREQLTGRQRNRRLLSLILCLFAALVLTRQLESQRRMVTYQQERLEPPGVTAARLRQERQARREQEAREAEQEASQEAEQREQERQFYRENRGKPDGYSVEKLKTLLRDKTMAQVKRLFGPPDDNAVLAGNEIWFYSNGIMNEATEKVDTLTIEFKQSLFSASDDDSKVKNFGTPAGRNYKP